MRTTSRCPKRSLILVFQIRAACLAYLILILGKEKNHGFISWSFDLWRRVVWYVGLDVSEEYIASNFTSILRMIRASLVRRKRETTNCIKWNSFIFWDMLQRGPLKDKALLAACFMLVSCFAQSSTLKMEATRSSETSAEFQRTARCYIPEDRTLHNHAVRASNPICRINLWS
jgi:hypothetical protein